MGCLAIFFLYLFPSHLCPFLGIVFWLTPPPPSPPIDPCTSIFHITAQTGRVTYISYLIYPYFPWKLFIYLFASDCPVWFCFWLFHFIINHPGWGLDWDQSMDVDVNIGNLVYIKLWKSLHNLASSATGHLNVEEFDVWNFFVFA